MKIASWILVLAFLFSLSCAAPVQKGKPIDAAKRAELVKGKTTLEQLTKLLGQPDYTEPLGAGVEKFVYEYYKEVDDRWYAPTKYDKQTLEVFLKNNVVQKYNFTREYRGEITE